jgi:large subunit ribosomal protein L4
VVLGSDDVTNWYSLRNLPYVHLIEAGQLNTYDVLNSEAIVFTAPALDEFLGVPVERTEAPVSTKKSEKAEKAGKDEKPLKAKAKADEDDEADADEADDADEAEADDDADEEEK